MPEHVADGRGAERVRQHLQVTRLIKGNATWCISLGGDAGRRVQGEDRRVSKPTKGPRLRRPVEVSERSGEPLEMMFRSVVIAIHRLERGLRWVARNGGFGSQHVCSSYWERIQASSGATLVLSHLRDRDGLG